MLPLDTVTVCVSSLTLTLPDATQAAARHHCSYLVQQHSTGFLEAGGEESWLSSLERAPTKLRSLQTLNKLLAHRPWLITLQHIQVRHDIHLPTHSLVLLFCPYSSYTVKVTLVNAFDSSH